MSPAAVSRKELHVFSATWIKAIAAVAFLRARACGLHPGKSQASLKDIRAPGWQQNWQSWSERDGVSTWRAGPFAQTAPSQKKVLHTWEQEGAAPQQASAAGTGARGSTYQHPTDQAPRPMPASPLAGSTWLEAPPHLSPFSS
ncbi:Hypothetical predicted protein [Podarcis lilfordi]|uniref:Uncharacterized protein n=1 Tax=Podarcis lilfordi TaxID=74358 RepID=A0AA35K1I0_9SAUR|nr:Hypothetical predicted protein [Podarcis lilfordi]